METRSQRENVFRKSISFVLNSLSIQCWLGLRSAFFSDVLSGVLFIFVPVVGSCRLVASRASALLEFRVTMLVVAVDVVIGLRFYCLCTVNKIIDLLLRCASLSPLLRLFCARIARLGSMMHFIISTLRRNTCSDFSSAHSSFPFRRDSVSLLPSISFHFLADDIAGNKLVAQDYFQVSFPPSSNNFILYRFSGEFLLFDSSTRSIA